MSSILDAISPKLLVHEQGFELPKDESGRRLDSATAYVPQPEGHRDSYHGKARRERSKGSSTATIAESLVTVSGCAPNRIRGSWQSGAKKGRSLSRKWPLA